MEKMKNTGRNYINKLSRLIGTDMMYVAKNGFWMNASFMFTSILGLISSIIFANFVSKTTYGNYQFILALASFIAVFVPNNMSSAVLQSVARGNEGDLKVATRFQLRWGVIGSVIASGVSLWYAINQNYNFSLALIAIALFMPATFAFNTWSAYVQGKKDYKRYFIYNTLVSAISYIGVFAIIFIKPDFFWIALANIIFGFIANFVIYFITLKKMCPNGKTDPETISYGKHLSIMGIPAGLAGQLDSILIFHFIGAETLAIYAFATILPEKLAGGLKLFTSIIFPKFSEKSEEDVRSFFNKKIWWLLGGIAIISGLYALISPYLFSWLFPTYMSSVPLTRLHALSFFSIAAGVIQMALTSQKKTRELYILTVSAPFIKASLLVILMFLYGVWGIIWAQLITIAYQIIFPIFLVKKQLPKAN